MKNDKILSGLSAIEIYEMILEGKVKRFLLILGEMNFL